MAKRASIKDREVKDAPLISKTETDQPQEQGDQVKAVGIGLKGSEWDRMDEIAQEMGITRHALALWALRDFMRRYDAGEIETQTRTTLPGL